MLALRPLHRGLSRAGDRIGRSPHEGPPGETGADGKTGKSLQRLSRDQAAHGCRPCLHRLRDVRHGLPQRGDHAGSQRRAGQAPVPYQPGGHPATARRAPERAHQPPGRDQVRPHLHADRPGPRRGPSRIRAADPARAGSCRPKRPSASTGRGDGSPRSGRSTL